MINTYKVIKITYPAKRTYTTDEYKAARESAEIRYFVGIEEARKFCGNINLRRERCPNGTKRLVGTDKNIEFIIIKEETK
ncbi:MAG: hypothetical protein IKU30_04835 [Clostridia bacterium]|nr:hypothetical protein [Clostridia bacterium]